MRMGEMNGRKEKKYPFLFSVIMAVYNVDQYLEEALQSLRNQSIGFRNIQVVLVDDGSTDGSGEICNRWAKRYPRNVVAFHQKNGGVSSARNRGLDLARGQYINFMDADDRISRNAFSRVFQFWQKNPGEDGADVVCIPVKCFGDFEGEPWENNKFDRGERVIDLQQEYQIRQAPVNSSFLKESLAKRHRFDEKLTFGEDFKYMIRVMAEKEKLGVVPGCCYLYRTRGNGSSATEKRKTQLSWYSEIFDDLYDGVNNRFLQERNKIPRWVQYGFLWDMKARIHDDEQRVMDRILTKDQQSEYLERIRRVLRKISDEVIEHSPDQIMDPFYKAWILQQKRKDQNPETGNAQTGVTGVDLFQRHFASTYLEVFSLEIRNGMARITGLVKMHPAVAEEAKGIAVSGGNHTVSCELSPAEYQSIIQYHETIAVAMSFSASIPLEPGVTNDLTFSLRRREGAEIRITHLEKGAFTLSCPFSSEFAVSGDWKYILTPDFIRLIPMMSGKAKLRREIRWDWTLLTRGQFRPLFYRMAARLIRKIRKKPIWLISDRIEKADDNGEAFFSYLVQHHSGEISPYFVISGKSPDFRRMKETGKTIAKGGFLHQLYFLICEVNVSASDRHIINREAEETQKWNADLFIETSFVFLQHGIIKDDLSEWLNKWEQNFAGFVTSVRPEYESILREPYGYTEKEVWMTGLPRYDRLENRAEKKVTVMPTWRAGLLGKEQDPRDGQRNLASDFENTDYCRFFHQLLNHPDLIREAEKNGYLIQFKLHPQMGSYADRFCPDPAVKVVPVEASYRDIFAESSLVVTDYSSAVFDFAYLRKPVMYAQYDRGNVFQGGHIYRKGYFDYERDGMGPVVRTVEETVQEIIRYMRTGCEMEQKYRDRANRFFAYADRKNAERVYEKILETLQEKKSCGGQKGKTEQ